MPGHIRNPQVSLLLSVEALFELGCKLATHRTPDQLSRLLVFEIQRTDTEVSMKSSVYFRQVHEGIRLEIRLTPDALASLKSDTFNGIELQEDDNCEWRSEGRLLDPNETDEPNEVVRIGIRVRVGDENSLDAE